MKPKHIAIILDGNRRYAKKRNLPGYHGHIKGSQKIEQMLNWALEFKIKELTLYAFSLENFKRDKKELNYLFDLFRKKIAKLKNDSRIKKHKIRVNFIGRLSKFPKDMQKDMLYLIEKTKKHNNFRLNLAMGYGSIAEVVDMVKNVLKKKIKKISKKTIMDNLYLKDSPDLLIRPGGEKRLSNFLLLQMAYTELYFSDKLWPEFSKKDFIRAIEDFEKRNRRYGK